MCHGPQVTRCIPCPGQECNSEFAALPMSGKKAASHVCSFRLFWVIAILCCVASAGAACCQGGDATRVMPTKSTEARDRVCFSPSKPPEVELPTIMEYGEPVLTKSARLQLRRPARIAWFFDLERFTDAEAELLARVPGSVFVGSDDGLSITAAKHFGRHRGHLAIGRMRELSDDAASALGQHRGGLTLHAVSRLSDNALRALARCQGALDIALDGLTAEQAQILSTRSDGLCLPRVRSLDRKTAEILGRYPGALELGLTEINADVAMNLARREGSLALGGALRLNTSAARELAAYRGELTIQQNFDGPAEEVLAAMTEHRGELVVVLDQPLTVAIARALRDHAGPVGVNAPPPFAQDAVALLTRAGQKSFLNTSGYDVNSAADLRALGAYQGIQLRLRLAGDLEEKAAGALSKYQGRLILEESRVNRVRASGEAISALAAKRGPLHIPSSFIRDDTIDSLSRHVGGLHISVSYTQSDQLGIDVLRKLADVDGWLRIDPTLPAEGLRVLASHRGDLVLGQLPQQDEEVIALLDRKPKSLYFPHDSAVKSPAAARLISSDVVASNINHTTFLLGRDAAEIASTLARKRGPLSLPYLKYMTTDALQALVQKEDVELLPLAQLYVFDVDGCIVSAASVVPEAFQEFNKQHQPPRELSEQKQFFEN